MKKGGRAGKLYSQLNLDHATLFGAGGYGVALYRPESNDILKLLYDPEACSQLVHEANIQQDIYRILHHTCPEVRVPRITQFTSQPIAYKKSPYLCGLGMEYLPPPLDFTESVHLILGYDGGDLDTSWGRTQSQLVSATNPTRGFFASPESLEWIWAQEESQMTIGQLAYSMGKANRILLDHHILPIDIEWIWSNGMPCMIDFGLCERGTISPESFLGKKGVRGLADDLYIPHKGDRGYAEFMMGFHYQGVRLN